ncbi:MAG: hypothetical protein LBF84_03580 [Holosporales bacterium]|nr:hypothetical protein [Holosporales bacterium]
MNNLIKLTGLALLLGYSFQNVVFAGELPAQPVQPTQRIKFTKAEDALLRELVAEIGTHDWELIADRMERNGMPKRTGKRHREHWNGLKSNNREPWTDKEKAILLEKYWLYGNNWAKIAMFLPGRTNVDVKNQWHMLAGRDQRPSAIDSCATGILQSLPTDLFLLSMSYRYPPADKPQEPLQPPPFQSLLFQSLLQRQQQSQPSLFQPLPQRQQQSRTPQPSPFRSNVPLSTMTFLAGLHRRYLPDTPGD